MGPRTLAIHGSGCYLPVFEAFEYDFECAFVIGDGLFGEALHVDSTLMVLSDLVGFNILV